MDFKVRTNLAFHFLQIECLLSMFSVHKLTTLTFPSVNFCFTVLHFFSNNITVGTQNVIKINRALVNLYSNEPISDIVDRQQMIVLNKI